MKLSRINLVLALLLIATVMSTAATRVDYTRPNVEILPDMKYSPAWQAYESNPHFADGRTLQTPLDGTIARGTLPLHFEATKEDALRAGTVLVNPYHDSTVHDATSLQASIQQGSETYRVYCISCHGSGGAGDGPVAKRGFPPPPSLLTGNSLKMLDGQLFHILTYGQGNMPGFAGQITREQRWMAINYLRSLQPTGIEVTPDDRASEPIPDSTESY